jgi:hypothetical protein
MVNASQLKFDCRCISIVITGLTSERGSVHSRRVTRVLLYVLYPSLFRGMFRLAQLLQRSGRYEPVVFFDRLPPYERDLAQCRAAGVLALDADGRRIGAAPARRRWRALPSLVTERLTAPSRSALVSTALIGPRFAVELADLLHQLGRARALLARERIGLVLVPGDSVGYATPMLIRAAHEARLAAGIVPFTVSNATEVLADVRRDPRHDAARLDNRAVAGRFPRWRRSDGDGRAWLRLAPARALAFEALALAPPDPWVLHSGAADSLAMESEYMRDHYQRNRLPVDRYALTGSLADDVAHAAGADGAARARVLAELGLPSRRVIAFALSDYSGFFRRGPAPGFATQAELFAFWIEALAACRDFVTVVSLHPWLRADELRHLERDNLRISTRPVEELIAIADLFVCSISATARTAIACGKPVIDHDPFAVRYPNFVGLEAVSIVETRADFTAALARLTGDATALAAATAAQRRIAPRFGRLDGGAGARMLSWIDGLEQGGPWASGDSSAG